MGDLDIICDRHVIPTILFLGEHGPCGRTEVYRNVSRTNNMPRKMDALMDAGLVIQKPEGVALTPKGERLASKLSELMEILSGN